MTRKDYILIARALQTPYQQSCRDVSRTVGWVAEFIANELEDDNPRFNRAHFLAVVKGEKALSSRPSRV